MSIAFAFVALPLAAALAYAQTPARGVDLAAMDRTADPCVDFYQFACGAWVAANPVPADRRSWGRFLELQDRNYDILRRILESPASDRDQEKAGAYFAACVDEQTIETKGAAPLEPELARIAALRSKEDLPDLVAHLHAIVGETPAPGSSRRGGVYVFFQLGARARFDDASTTMANVTPDGIAMPSRDYYINTDARSVKRRDAYRAHVAQMLAMSGVDDASAARGADAVLRIETTLAEAMLDVAARRDPNAVKHPMAIAALQEMMPAFNWRRYLDAMRVPSFDDLNVSEPIFMQAVNHVVAATPLDDIKLYLRWHAVHAAARMLPARFVAADFGFFGRELTGQEQPPPRWRECIADVDDKLGEALGKAYVEQAFGPAAKADMLRMVRDIKQAMGRDIDASPWMSDETKKAAHAKLDAVVDRIGYPDRWRQYAAVRVTRDDALGNRDRTTAFANARRLERIGKPVDRDQWNMTPPTVNAYYSTANNTINFPAGILQPPFYDPQRDAAVNYGAIGGVIGHELTHGFDDQGRKYDPRGNLRDWWTPKDGAAFEEKAACIADQYSTYVVAGDTHVNGRLTLGENTADNGGLRLALMAYLAGPGAAAPPQAIDGFTPEQRVFLGWAQVWCENSRPEAERLKAATNPHASNRYRVNGPVSNMPEFAHAFSCKGDAPMVRPNACRVW